ncbi:P-loop containing nucleoside triphosphate hydrolase protein [Exidia glandulosa HHB12029]|uniref:p-loop containing nucleoside triphosphate hydrolase protein n=1 Tax=Exidia glandulosa HHB12029 TaxID=1314781 RepID=A0A165BY47_EXIGL|nr:P-loop containing nucleoside triphosphate hydrolase protein [Exidia glandulosa HHB12029]
MSMAGPEAPVATSSDAPSATVSAPDGGEVHVKRHDEAKPEQGPHPGHDTDLGRVASSSSSVVPEALLALPPPPSYDVFVRGLSIAAPPYAAYIPTPIPIKIPQPVTSFLLRRFRKQPATDVEQGRDELIVRDVSASVRAGEMMAIIGGSGSGKTTLLHAIASRLGNLPVAAGNVVIAPSGGSASEHKLKGLSDVIGFVRQHDYLLPHLTVRETLTTAAQLRLPSSVSPATRTMIVEQTILELGLSDAADTIVGGAGRKGISGGEKRRVSIGCVLVSFPSVLVLDEPTTGLDSFTAFQLLETLSRLARRGRTVILSLHQPRSDAFPLFDRLVLLSRGHLIFAGPREDALPHFADIDPAWTPERDTNPLDFMIDLSSIDARDDEREAISRARVDRLVAAWKAKSSEAQSPVAVKFTEKAEESGATQMAGKRPNAVKQFSILFPRSVKNAVRAYPELVGHLLTAILIGLLMGITFYRLGEQPNDVQSLKTLAFQVVPVYGYMTQVVWIYKWCTSLVVFDREREDGLYAPSAWLAAEFIAWLPVNILGSGIYTIMVYWICNLRTDSLAYNFGTFLGDMIIVQLCFVSWALLTASVERSFARASLLGNALSIFFILSPGFFVVHVPGWIRWCRWISPYFYSFRVCILTQFRGREFACEGVEGVVRNQCVGDNAIRSLRINPSQPLAPMFAGLLGFMGVCLGLALLLLTVWKPGGVRFARAQSSSERKGKEAKGAQIELARAPVDVQADEVTLTHVSRVPPVKEVPILTGVSATFRSGEVTVIMGPSGSGKSTFLRTLAGRRPQSAGLLARFVRGGEVRFNGEVVSEKRMQRLSAFVEQEDDYHMPALTVRETLKYAAIVKLPRSVSRRDKEARAEEVLNMLGLKECADNLVGGENLKGISGGEKRRLSLACQMINDPAVLVVDEPTSGLDSNTAQNVMEALRDIARSGRTVIASLHQPRSDIFQLGDHYVILAKRGNVVFAGPREHMLPYFASLGHECPPLYNPSDFVMDLISVDVRGRRRQATTTARIDSLVQGWRNREKKQAEAFGGSPPPSEESKEKVKTMQGIGEHDERTPMFVALPVLLERSWHNLWRQSDLFWTRLIQAPILAVCFFVFFLRLTHGATGAQDRIGIVAESTSALPFVGFLNLASLYPQEKTIFFHDYRSAGGRYNTATFVLAFTLFALIPEVLSAIGFAAVLHVGSGMQTNARIFFEFAISCWVQLSFGESIGIAFCSYWSAMGLAVSLVSCFLTVASQSSGVFSASIAKFLEDIAWIFPMKYGARVMLINEMTDMHFNCSAEEIQTGACSAVDGQQILDLYGYHDSTAKLMGIMIAVTIAYRLAAWGILTLRMRSNN